MKKHTKSYFKKKAWKVFSLYIRKSNMNSKGELTCYTCGARKHYKEMQAGHAIGGRGNAVLFMEDLVRVQDKACNIFRRGNYPVFTQKLIEEHGMKKYKELVDKANTLVQYKATDYERIAEEYTAKLNNL